MAARAGTSPNWNHDGRRAQRLNVAMKAGLRRTGTTKFDVDVHDLSVSGFRFDTAYNLQAGTRVWLTVPGLEGLEAKVMWRDGFHYGAAFKAPLHMAVLDHIFRQYRKRD